MHRKHRIEKNSGKSGVIWTYEESNHIALLFHGYYDHQTKAAPTRIAHQLQVGYSNMAVSE
jgi:hypothetical protein